MDKNSFQSFRRSQTAELRPFDVNEDLPESISISAEDTKNGSPKLGDMIARNPANHNDQWLVAADYFAANFEPLASHYPFHGKETSSRVSSVAAGLMNLSVADLRSIVDETAGTQTILGFVADVKSIAASCLTQDENAPFTSFLDRLKIERKELDGRLVKLNKYTGNGSPGSTPRHRTMLAKQAILMSDLLAVLDERIADLQIEERAAPVPEISDGQ